MHRYVRIARMGLWLGATVFGGVAAAYPVVRQRAGELANITADDVDGLYALSVALPGPSFINFWGAIAGRVGGIPGVIIGQICLLLPAFCLVLLLPLFVRIPYIAAHGAGALNGAVWATAGLLLAAGIDHVRTAKRPRQLAALALLLLLLIIGVHPTVLLAISIATGVLYSVYKTPGKAA